MILNWMSIIWGLVWREINGVEAVYGEGIINLTCMCKTYLVFRKIGSEELLSMLCKTNRHISITGSNNELFFSVNNQLL